MKVNTYDDVDEPRFDPRLHLDLQHPEYIRLLTDFEKTKKYPKVTDHNGSPFAYSAPFQACTIIHANIQFAHPLEFANIFKKRKIVAPFFFKPLNILSPNRF